MQKLRRHYLTLAAFLYQSQTPALKRVIVSKWGPAQSAEPRRMVRAVEVLENIGTAEARTLLESLAAGEAGTLLTTEAKASLNRLTRQFD